MIPDDPGLLARVRDLFAAADPVPPDLTERIRFALALRQLNAEVARIVRADEAALSARGTEESRTITFDSDSLTIMIRIDSNPGESVRVDGWLAPPQSRRVEMRMTGASLDVMADGSGRFVFPDVPRGSARVVVHAPEGPPAGAVDGDGAAAVKSVITPALILLASGKLGGG
ncbi:MAG TPA: hypothetical protein VMU95_14835 [Trebonia sp.]|nr:hypothetical protein [Trebonia sp.]